MPETSSTGSLLIEKEWKYDLDKLNNLLAPFKEPRDKKLIYNLDLNEFGKSFIKSCKLDDNNYDFKDGHIAQVSRVQDISMSKSEEASVMSQVFDDSDRRVKRNPKAVYIITVTDGSSKINIIDLIGSDNCANLFTPPGTKICLTGIFPCSNGYLIHQKKSKNSQSSPQITVRAGLVESLYEDWKWSMTVDKSKRIRNTLDGYPKFHPYGSREIQSLVRNQSIFLDKQARLVERSFGKKHNNNAEKPYDSFANDTTKEVEEDVQFTEERLDKISSLHGSKHPSGRREYSSVFQIARQFIPGGSRFYSEQTEKRTKLDGEVSQIIAHGYSLAQAKNALNVNNKNLSQALSYLESRKNSVRESSSRGGGRGDRRGRGRNRRGAVGHEESRPAPANSGFLDLGSIIGELDNIPTQSLSARCQPAQPQPGSSCGIRFHVKKMAIGSPILAESMSGTFLPATLWGWDQHSHDKKLVRISYDHSQVEDSIGIKHLKMIDGKPIDAEKIPDMERKVNNDDQQRYPKDSAQSYRGNRQSNRRGTFRGSRSHRRPSHRGRI